MSEVLIILCGFFGIVVMYAFFKKYLAKNNPVNSVREYQIKIVKKMIKDMDISKEELFDEEKDSE